MRLTGWIVLVYALLILVGGVIGHIKAASTVSLVMGIVFGALLAGSSLLIFKNKKAGLYSALILSLLLDLFFTYRFVDKLKFFPSAFLSIVSLAMIVILALELRKKH
jgi:Small integral membrane protein